MSKIGNLLVLGLVALFGVVAASFFHFHLAEGERRLVLSESNLSSPAHVVKLYVDAAINGDEEVIGQLVATPPDSYSFMCTTNRDERSQTPIIESNVENERIVNPPMMAEGSLYEDRLIEGDVSPDDRFIMQTRSDSKWSVAFLEARYLYVSSPYLREYQIVNSIERADEARIDVRYKLASDRSRGTTFLLHREESWRIFMTYDSDTLDRSVNRNYSFERPRCDETGPQTTE